MFFWGVFASNVKNWISLASFSFIFCLFQTTITIFTTNWCEKCQAKIHCWHSNPKPSNYESAPITIRQGSCPLLLICCSSCIAHHTMKASIHFFQTLPTTSREVRAYSNISMGKQISQYTMSTLKQKNELRILIADISMG